MNACPRSARSLAAQTGSGVTVSSSGPPAGPDTRSAMNQQPVVQLTRRVHDVQRRMGSEVPVVVRAVADADARGAGVGGELQVMCRVADHQRALGLDLELV